MGMRSCSNSSDMGGYAALSEPVTRHPCNCNMPASEAVLCCLQALYDAAEDDAATGGPDMARRIFPVVTMVTGDGFRRLPEAETAQAAQRVVAGRMDSPDGPAAPLRD